MRRNLSAKECREIEYFPPVSCKVISTAHRVLLSACWSTRTRVRDRAKATSVGSTKWTLRCIIDQAILNGDHWAVVDWLYTHNSGGQFKTVALLEMIHRDTALWLIVIANWSHLTDWTTIFGQDCVVFIHINSSLIVDLTGCLQPM